MRTRVTLNHAQSHLGELIDRVEADGEEFLITVGDRPMAMLTPTSPRPAGVAEALDLLEAARRASRPRSETLRGLIDSGRGQAEVGQ